MSASNDGCIVDPQNVDGNQLCRTIGSHKGDTVAIGQSADKFTVRSVTLICPDACCIDAEFTVTIVTVHVRLSNEGITAIHIDRSQCAGSRQKVIRLFKLRGVHASNDGGIIDTKNINSNDLSGAIAGRDRDVITISDAIDKFAVCSIGRVRPSTRCIDTEFTVTIAAVHVCQNNKGIGVVDIRSIQHSRSCQDSIGFCEKC